MKGRIEDRANMGSRYDLKGERRLVASLLLAHWLSIKPNLSVCFIQFSHSVWKSIFIRAAPLFQ